MLEKLFRLASWSLAVIILALSIVPATVRPVTGTGQNFEHVLAFMALGATFGLGYPRVPARLFIALPLFAGAVELSQLLVPSRHARMGDFVVDAGAALLGVAISWLLNRLKAKILARRVLSPRRSL